MLALRSFPPRILLRHPYLADSCVLSVLLSSSRTQRLKFPLLTRACVRLYESQIQNYTTPTVPETYESKSTIQKDIKVNSESVSTKKPKRRHKYEIPQDDMDNLVSQILDDLKKDDILVEFSPGGGDLTKELLSSTSNNVVLYEPLKNTRDNLQKTLSPWLSRLQFIDFDFEHFLQYYVREAYDPENSKLRKFLEPLPVKGEEANSSVKVVGVTENKRFLRSLFDSAAIQSCLFEEIFPVFYIFVNKVIYANSKKRCPWIHFFLHIEEQGESFIGKEGRRKKMMYVLLKIKRNEEIFSKV